MLLSTNMAEEGLPFLCYKVTVIKSVFHQKVGTIIPTGVPKKETNGTLLCNKNVEQEGDLSERNALICLLNLRLLSQGQQQNKCFFMVNVFQ